MNKSLAIGIPVMALATIVLSAQTSLAQSAPPDEAATPENPHCVVLPDQPVKCFATEAEAMRVGTGDDTTPTPNGTTSPLNQAAQRLPLRAILYEHETYNTHRRGLVTYIFGNCGVWGNIPPVFNDKTTSLRVGFCGLTLYEHANRNAGRRGWVRYFAPGSNIPNVGANINDETSSWSLPSRR